MENENRFSAENCPTAWFATLERAIRAKNEQRAKECEAELRLLGFDIKASPAAVLAMGVRK